MLLCAMEVLSPQSKMCTGPQPTGAWLPVAEVGRAPDELVVEPRGVDPKQPQSRSSNRLMHRKHDPCLFEPVADHVAKWFELVVTAAQRLAEIEAIRNFSVVFSRSFR